MSKETESFILLAFICFVIFCVGLGLGIVIGEDNMQKEWSAGRRRLVDGCIWVKTGDKWRPDGCTFAEVPK